MRECVTSSMRPGRKGPAASAIVERVIGARHPLEKGSSTQAPFVPNNRLGTTQVHAALPHGPLAGGALPTNRGPSHHCGALSITRGGASTGKASAGDAIHASPPRHAPVAKPAPSHTAGLVYRRCTLPSLRPPHSPLAIPKAAIPKACFRDCHTHVHPPYSFTTRATPYHSTRLLGPASSFVQYSSSSSSSLRVSRSPVRTCVTSSLLVTHGCRARQHNQLPYHGGPKQKPTPTASFWRHTCCTNSSSMLRDEAAGSLPQPEDCMLHPLRSCST